MGKRGRGSGGDGGKGKKRKFATSGIVEPGQYGVYATCPKFKEKMCLRELGLLFNEKLEEFYGDAEGSDADDEDDEELSIEDAIKKEVAGLKDTSKEARKAKKVTEVELGCECLVFLKCRKPIVPSTFVEKICEQAVAAKAKNTRVTQRLAPIDDSCSASVEELKKMAKRVLEPHFHAETDQNPYTFAIQVNRRNFNQVDKMEIINTIAATVGKDHGHKVDLKNQDKLILVECFKSSIGMSVLDNYNKYYKFNLQKIFEEHGEGDKVPPESTAEN